MNKTSLLFLILLLLLFVSACTKQVEVDDSTLNTQDMIAISELAVMDCYFHNVARVSEEDAEGFLFWKKDRNFWIEYSGIVTIGFDTSLIEIQINGQLVTITLPHAEVLSSQVDQTSLTEESYYYAANSAKASAEDQTQALTAAQIQMETLAKEDQTLLSEAEYRIQKLLGDYIDNIGELSQTEYTYEFIFIEKSEIDEGEQ